MIDTDRQLPSPEAPAWSIDLAAVGGPLFVVLRCDEHQARAALARHLVEMGSVTNTIAAERLVASAPISSVAVIW